MQSYRNKAVKASQLQVAGAMEAVRKTAYGKQLAQILGSYKVDDSTAEDRLYDKRGAAQAAYQAKKHWWNPGGGFSGVQ